MKRRLKPGEKWMNVRAAPEQKILLNDLNVTHYVPSETLMLEYLIQLGLAYPQLLDQIIERSLTNHTRS